MAIDNITLALLSLKKNIKDYLDTQNWSDYYNMFLYGDSYLNNKEIVLKKSRNNQIELPIIIIDTGTIRDEPYELGSEYGRDLVTLMLITMAKDSMQLRTISNLIRRYLNDLVFDIYDYSSKSETQLDTGQITDVMLTDVSSPDSDNIADRYVTIINANLKLDAENFI